AEELPPLVTDPGAREGPARRLERRLLPTRELLDLLRDAHAAPVVTAHGAEIGVDLEVLVVKGTRRLAVEGELELPWPVEGGAGARQIVVPGACAGDSAGDVARVGGDLVGDAARLHVLGLRQADVLLGRHVAEHRGARARGFRRADRTRQVVIAREDVG